MSERYDMVWETRWWCQQLDCGEDRSQWPFAQAADWKHMVVAAAGGMPLLYSAVGKKTCMWQGRGHSCSRLGLMETSRWLAAQLVLLVLQTSCRMLVHVAVVAAVPNIPLKPTPVYCLVGDNVVRRGHSIAQASSGTRRVQRCSQDLQWWLITYFTICLLYETRLPILPIRFKSYTITDDSP